MFNKILANYLWGDVCIQMAHSVQVQSRWTNKFQLCVLCTETFQRVLGRPQIRIVRVYEAVKMKFNSIIIHIHIQA